MIVPLAILALSLHVMPVADRPHNRAGDSMPNLAVDQSCREQASRTDPLGASNKALGGTVQGCLSSEHAARDKLRSEWKDFTATQRRRCDTTATMGGEPSYVELLTCLEMTKQADELHNGQTSTAETEKSSNKHQPK